MAQRTTFSFELFLYSLILLLALALRFADLGVAPLTEFEARAALPAHEAANRNATELGDQPAYVLLTRQVFSLFGSSEFAARLLPALFGLALVALPYFWRDLLGQKAALALAFVLALDPGMVAVSRLASGHMVAVGAGLIALTAWRYTRPIAAGIFSAVALLASPLVYFGLTPALLVWLTLQPEKRTASNQWRPFLIAAVTTLVFGGTWLLTTPGGLGGLGSTAVAFLGRFVEPGVPAAEIGLAMLGYALPAVVFGILGAVNAWRRNHSVGKVLSLFALFSFLLVLVNPGRQVADLLWVVIALWALTAVQVADYISLPRQDLNVALGEAGLMLILGIFFGISLSKLAANYTDFIFVAVATLLLAAVATLLIAFGWSRTGAMHGFMWAVLGFAALFLLAASSRFLRVETTDANDLWAPGPAAGSIQVLEESLHDLSVLDQGQQNELAVDLRREGAALAWEVRALPPAENDASPPLIVGAMEMQGEEFAAYRGQDIALSVHRAWQGWPPNFFAWLLYRQGPTRTEEIVLWARADLFPDAQAVSAPDPEANP